MCIWSSFRQSFICENVFLDPRPLMLSIQSSSTEGLATQWSYGISLIPEGHGNKLGAGNFQEGKYRLNATIRVAVAAVLESGARIIGWVLMVECGRASEPTDDCMYEASILPVACCPPCITETPVPRNLPPCFQDTLCLLGSSAR